MAYREVMLSPVEYPLFKGYRFITEPFRVLGEYLSTLAHKATTGAREGVRRAFNSRYEYALVAGKVVLRRSTGKTGLYKSIQGKSVKVGEASRKPTMDMLWENAHEVVALKDAAKEQANKRRIDNNLIAEMGHKIISVGG